jgi:hypothetical protein
MGFFTLFRLILLVLCMVFSVASSVQGDIAGVALNLVAVLFLYISLKSEDS